MRLRVSWTADGAIVLPWNYLHLLHGFLYAAIRKASPKLGEFLHEQGFVVGSHRYKLVTFSLLFPKRSKAHKDGLEMTPPILWWVSSPLPAPIEALAMTLATETQFRIGKVYLMVERIEVEELPNFTGRCLFQTLSPIVASTGVRKGEKLEHKFLSPNEPEFWRVVEMNLRRKAQALDLEFADEPLKFEPVGEWKSRLYEVQGTKVRGFEGQFWAEGNSELLKIGYDAGFGERNAQGFGMVKLVRCQEVTKGNKSEG
ncbi:MAG: CRISPR-associated endoribonuclease Cas6 [Armatimonadetes bacterium]|nr:CRISPR-associated endoribonuclease Cas6 [Armatimonadota bacterium]MDW8029981.1 CRISPR-associated endoribonuclease Cas6 [Armatimonadota bacterium]